jgi:hypothetical protein
MMNRDLVFAISAICLLVLAFVISPPANAQGGIIANHEPLGAILGRLEASVDARIDHAANRAEYLEEKTLRQLALLIDNLHEILRDQQETLWGNLAPNLQNSLRQIESVLDRADQLAGKVLELEDFMVLDLQMLINEMPWKAERFLLRRIDGYSQFFQPTGTYTYRLVGNAFQPDNRIQASIAGAGIQPEWIHLGERAHTVRFEIPAQILNPRFPEQGSPRRVPFVLVVTRPAEGLWSWLPFGEKETEVFRLEESLTLLPKLAATYELREHLAQDQPAAAARWSGWSAEITVPGRRSECSGCGSCPSCSRANCEWGCLRLPAGSVPARDGRGQIIADKRETDSPYGKFGCNPPIIRDTGEICWRYKNWHTREHHASFRVKYFPREKAVTKQLVSLTKLGSDDSVGGLEFGQTYQRIFVAGYQSFDLVLRLFNGREIQATPGSASNTALLDHSVEAMPDFKRLIIRLKRPQG